jgi:hypothetical protein
MKKGIFFLTQICRGTDLAMIESTYVLPTQVFETMQYKTFFSSKYLKNSKRLDVAI